MGRNGKLGTDALKIPDLFGELDAGADADAGGEGAESGGVRV
jgi:hypothetical protein